MKVDPRPGSDNTVNSPPCASTIRREIVSPSPEPPAGHSGPARRSVILARYLRFGSRTVTEMATRHAANRRQGDRAPAGVARLAFDVRLMRPVDLIAVHEHSGRSGGASNSSRRPSPRFAGRSPARARAGTGARKADRRRRPRLDLRQIEQLSHQVVEPLGILAAPEDLLASVSAPAASSSRR